MKRPQTMLSFFFCFFFSLFSSAVALEGVSLSPSITTKDGQKLQHVGAGLRSKKILMLQVRAYVGEFFIADIGKFKKTPAEALKSVTEAAPAMMELHFLRDVEPEKIHASFIEALEINKVDLKKPEIQKFLDAVKTGGEAKKGKSLSVLGVKRSDGSEIITYENADAKTTAISGGPGFIQNIFSIWLGQASDEGIEKLKAEILK